MEKNLGHATAYGYAKSKGYSGTEEEFAELMADYASVGQSAAQSAEQAAASATSASGSAATATQAAQTATSKASEAVTAADTATTKASEASQSASTASTAATSASTSAQTATTAASTATTKASEAAVSANTATTAKTDAETARDAAAQSASQAEQSAESIDPDEFDRKIYAAFATDTASGSIAHFEDGADSIPMKDVLIHIEPVQEGSGDPSPDNVRPISGWTAVKVTRVGKNLIYPKYRGRTNYGITYTVNDDGSITATGTASGTSYSATNLTDTPELMTLLAPGTYTLTGGMSAKEVVYLGGKLIDGTIFSSPRDAGSGATFTLTNYARVYPQLMIGDGTTPNRTYNIQLELGSIATDYEPYQGETYDITFPTEAGTVYGGLLDVTKGELVVDKIEIDLTTGMSGGTAGSNYVFYKQLSNVKTVSNSQIADILNEAYTPIRFNAVSMESGTIALRDNQTLYVNTGSDSIYPVGKAILPLATPITYTLTPQEITSLLGANNVWADTGDSEVEYRADTKMYITKKITEAVSALS